jgi:hypothetical protein
MSEIHPFVTPEDLPSEQVWTMFFAAQLECNKFEFEFELWGTPIWKPICNSFFKEPKTLETGITERSFEKQEIVGAGSDWEIRQRKSPNLMETESNTGWDFLIGERCLIREENWTCFILQFFFLVTKVHCLSSSSSQLLVYRAYQETDDFGSNIKTKVAGLLTANAETTRRTPKDLM